MNRIPIRSKEIIWRNLEGEAVLLNPQTGKYFGINEVGCSFWEKVDGKKSIADIIDLLLNEYDVERKTLENDINELVAAMEKQNIVIYS